jgi:hypothetical protein
MWWGAAIAGHRRSSATAGGACDVGPDEIERWLCGPAAPGPSLDDMASVFGLSFDAAEGSSDIASAPHRLRFTLAVLRDAFPDDGAARRWLRAPDAERGGVSPLDLLLSGRVEQLEELAVREWKRRLAAAGAPPIGAGV